MDPHLTDLDGDVRSRRELAGDPIDPDDWACPEPGLDGWELRDATGPVEFEEAAWRRGGGLTHRGLLRWVRALLVAALVGAVGLLALAVLPDGGVRASDNPLAEMAQLALDPPVQAQPRADRSVLHVVYEVNRIEGQDPRPGAEGKAPTWHAWRRPDGSGREDRAGEARAIDPAFGIIGPDEPWVERRLPNGRSTKRPADAGTAASLSATIGGYAINQSLIDDLPRQTDALRDRLADLVSGRSPSDPTTGSSTTARSDGTPAGPGSRDAGIPAAGRRTDDVLLFRGATDLLASWIAPPTLRSSALELVGAIEGVTVRQGTDPRGRSVLVVALAHGGRDEVFIDPATSAVTGHRTVDAHGTVIEDVVLIAADWVAVVPEP